MIVSVGAAGAVSQATANPERDSLEQPVKEEVHHASLLAQRGSLEGEVPAEGADPELNAIFNPTEDLKPRARRHKDWYWVGTEATYEERFISIREVVELHGVPEHIVLNHIQEEMAEERSIMSLPFAIILVVLYALMSLSHDSQVTSQSVEEAIDFDIINNANFAYSEPGHMGFKNYQDVNNYADFWSWMHRGFAAVYWWEDRLVSEGSTLDLGALTPDEREYYLYQNRKLLPVRLASQDVEAVDCDNDEMSNAFGIQCYGDATLDLALDPTEFDVAQVEFKKAETHWLELDSYKSTLKQLESEGFVNPRTYRIVVSFVTYNANLDMLVLSNVHFLFARSGRIWKTITHQSFKLTVYTSWKEWMWSILFYSQITFLFIKELWEVIKALRDSKCNFVAFVKDYFNFWNGVDWISFMMAYALLGCWLAKLVALSAIETDLRNLPSKLEACENEESCMRAVYASVYEKIEDCGRASRDLGLLGSFYPCVIMMRLFKAFQTQPRLALVAVTLHKSAGDLAHFLMVFLAAFLSFVVMGIALFGNEIAAFSQLDRATFALFRMLVGDFDFDALEGNNRIIGLVYFALFQISMFLILLNMLVAIVLDTYSDVKGSLSKSETLWGEVWQTVVRAWGNYAGTRQPFKTILTEYEKQGGESMYQSNKCIKLHDFMDAVPKLYHEQAQAILVGSCEDWIAHHHRPIAMTEVMSTASKVAEWSGQIPRMSGLVGAEQTSVVRAAAGPTAKPSELSDERQSKGSQETQAVATVSSPRNVEALSLDAMSFEDLIVSAQRRLQKDFGRSGDESGQVQALAQVLTSMRILAAQQPPQPKSPGGAMRGLSFFL